VQRHHDRFLRRTVCGLRRLGVRVAAATTDNGSCYKSHRFEAACRRLGLRHLRTRRYTPRISGKVERFINTALLEWAYARVYRQSEARRAALLLGCTITTGIGATRVSAVDPRSPGCWPRTTS
jgi:transposase InsO family protein